MTEISGYAMALLLTTGVVAGVINTLAGGGSNLTVPALMLMGLPADLANATNRVGVLVQTVVSARGFHRHGKLEAEDAVPILVPTVLGAGVGALGASLVPAALLKPVLLVSMVTMALIILVRPSTVAPLPGEPPKKLRGNRATWFMLFAAGIYGGFVQAGVGFMLIAALAGGLRYDLVRANALKVLCTAVLTSVAIGIFVWQGQVVWLPGTILALGTTVGAHLGVRMALRASQAALKWFLFGMTLFASAAALWF